jgi:hypothetical protein
MPVHETISVIPPILRQHAEGAAFLWSQRVRMFHDPAFGEVELGRLDRRLGAHIDGLLASGSAALGEVAARFEDFPEPGEMFAWFAVALLGGGPEDIAAALERAGGHPKCWSGLSGAIAWAGTGYTYAPYATRIAPVAPAATDAPTAKDVARLRARAPPRLDRVQHHLGPDRRHRVDSPSHRD